MKYLTETKPLIQKYLDAIEEKCTSKGEPISFKVSNELRHLCNTIYQTNPHNVETLNYIIPILRWAAKNLKDIIRVPYATRAYNYLIRLDVLRYRIDKEHFSEDEGYQDIFDCLSCRNIYVYDDCEDIVSLLEQILGKELVSEILEEAKGEWHNHLVRDSVELSDEFLSCIDEVQTIVEKKIKKDPSLNRWNLIKEELSLRGISWTSPATLNDGALFD